MKGKIIQIGVTGVANVMGTQCNYVIVALTDAGEIWERSDTWGWQPVSLPTDDEGGK